MKSTAVPLPSNTSPTVTPADRELHPTRQPRDESQTVPEPAPQRDRHPLRGWLRRLYLASGLPKRVDTLVAASPPLLRRYLAARLLETRVRNGYRFVPERALETAFRKALTLLNERSASGTIGSYLEFGVAHGGSMACMWRALDQQGLDDVDLIGFDSFAGLPPEADWEDGALWQSGQFHTERGFTERFLRDQQVDMERVTLVEGWFEHTLNADTRHRLGLRKAGVIMIDCDLASSTRAALAFCAPLIEDHAVILFDDWNAGGLAARNLGEKRAFGEFLASHPEFVAEQLSSGSFGRYSDNAEIFLVSRLPGTLN